LPLARLRRGKYSWKGMPETPFDQLFSLRKFPVKGAGGTKTAVKCSTGR